MSSPQLTEVNDLIAKLPESDKAKVSDGYHTFDALYDHRCALFIALCAHYQSALNVMQGKKSGNKGQYCYRSRTHFDGSTFEWQFILQLHTTAGQISYHLPEKYWDSCGMAEELEKAHKWDGHTSEDVLDRLLAI